MWEGVASQVFRKGGRALSELPLLTQLGPGLVPPVRHTRSLCKPARARVKGVGSTRCVGSTRSTCRSKNSASVRGSQSAGGALAVQPSPQCSQPSATQAPMLTVSNTACHAAPSAHSVHSRPSGSCLLGLGIQRHSPPTSRASGAPGAVLKPTCAWAPGRRQSLG